MGIADLVPGVSGGTVALILGIYADLIRHLRSFDLSWLGRVFSLAFFKALCEQHLRFMATLCLGIVLAVYFFTRIVSLPELLHDYPDYVYSVFFGLIVGSVFLLLKETKGKRKGGGPLLSMADMFIIGVGIVTGLLIVTAVPVETPTQWWFIMLCGAIAVSAMLLPGVSGSFLLLILGKYAYILEAIGRFDIAVLAPFGLGVTIGLMVFTRVIDWLLRHFYRLTMMLVKGVLIASLWVIWPLQNKEIVNVAGKEKVIAYMPYWPDEISSHFITMLGIICMAAIFVLFLERLARMK